MREHGQARVGSSSARRARRRVLPGLAVLATAGLLFGTTTPASAEIGTTQVNLTGTAAADLTVWRPSTGEWYALSLGGSTFTTTLGQSGDQPVPEDFTGDGIADVALYRPTTGTWYIRASETGITSEFRFGIETDVPVPGDYVGDDKADIAIYRSGVWWIRDSGTGAVTVQNFGSPADFAEPADFDGDGKLDLAVQRPSGQNWWKSSADTFVRVVNWGTGTDENANGDYDGDGIADWMKVRSTGGTYVWWALNSSSPYAIERFGNPTTDFLAPADYDGDGRIDIAIFRPDAGQWWIKRSSTGTALVVNWGQAGDFSPMTSYTS